MSKMDSPQEEKSADNDTSYITQTTFETKSLKSMNMQKTSPLKHGTNEKESTDISLKQQVYTLFRS